MGEAFLIYTVSKRWCVMSRPKWKASISQMKLVSCTVRWLAGCGGIGGWRGLKDLRGHDLASSQSLSEFHQTTGRYHSRLKLQQPELLSPSAFPSQQNWAVCHHRQTPDLSYKNLVSHSTSVLVCCLHYDIQCKLENVLELAPLLTQPVPTPPCYHQGRWRHYRTKIYVGLDVCTSDFGWHTGPQTNDHIHIIKLTGRRHKSNLWF